MRDEAGLLALSSPVAGNKENSAFNVSCNWRGRALEATRSRRFKRLHRLRRWSLQGGARADAH